MRTQCTDYSLSVQSTYVAYKLKPYIQYVNDSEINIQILLATLAVSDSVSYVLSRSVIHVSRSNCLCSLAAQSITSRRTHSQDRHRVERGSPSPHPISAASAVGEPKGTHRDHAFASSQHLCRLTCRVAHVPFASTEKSQIRFAPSPRTAASRAPRRARRLT